MLFKDEVRATYYWSIVTLAAVGNLWMTFSALGISVHPKDIVSEASLLSTITSPKTVAPVVIAFVFILLRFLIPQKLRLKIAHFKLRDPLPGCRAVTLAKSDARIDMNKFPAIPRSNASGETQNQWWYSMYKTIKMQPEIVSAQRVYLLLRDLAVFQALMTTLFVVVWFVIGEFPIELAVSLIMYIVLATATNNSGTTFVRNVLATWPKP